MKLIGISGKRGVGKTTAARYLERFYGFKKLSFADEIRSIAKSLFKFSDTDFTDIRKKESDFLDYDWTPREFLINLGEFLRYHDRDYFLKHTLNKIPAKSKGLYVIDDVRYENEAEMIKKGGGSILRITRYQKENPYGKNLDIPSETALDNYKYDYIIHEFNNQSLTKLTGQLDNYMDDLEISRRPQ